MTREPGIYTMTNDAYHQSEGISKTGLFTIYKRTPFHYRFGERKETNGQRFGNAAHTAVLEPLLFEDRYLRGPEDRRGNKWTSACEIAQAAGKECLTASDYDDAMRLRDVLHRDADVRKLTKGAPAIEQSGFAVDPATGEMIRCRPDIYSHDMGVMADLKATTDASPWEWRKRVEDYAYHFQESLYTEVWQNAGGGKVNAFLFIVIEKDPPFAYKLYELKPSAVQEGHAIYRKALEDYHACMTLERDVCAKYPTPGPDRDALLLDCWPKWGQGVDELDISKWAYKMTTPAEDEE